MRLSVLALDSAAWNAGGPGQWIDSVARFVADHNTTTIAISGVTQSTAAPLVDGSLAVHIDNNAYRLSEHLASFGLKYSLLWARSYVGENGQEEGTAVLSQLPVLQDCPRIVTRQYEANDPRSRACLVVRLAVSPNAVVDLYSVRLDDDATIDEFVRFVDDTPEILERMKPPPPKRRGPPRKRILPAERPVLTRVACLAADLRGVDAATLAKRGFFDAIAATGAPAARGLSCRIFIRPALRPQCAMDAVYGDRTIGAVADFEV